MKKRLYKRIDILKALENDTLKFNQLKRLVSCNGNTLSNQLNNKDYGLVTHGFISKIKDNGTFLFKLNSKGKIELRELNNEVIQKELYFNTINSFGKIVIKTIKRINKNDILKLSKLEKELYEEIKKTSLKDATVSVRLKFWCIKNV